MNVVEIDGRSCRSEGDFYRDLLGALGAPDWHGRNLDAVWDSVSSDNINAVKAPFEVRIKNAHESKCVDLIMKVKSIFEDARDEGVDVRCVLE